LKNGVKRAKIFDFSVTFLDPPAHLIDFRIEKLAFKIRGKREGVKMPFRHREGGDRRKGIKIRWFYK
jgi:hypothetical protein